MASSSISSQLKDTPGLRTSAGTMCTGSASGSATAAPNTINHSSGNIKTTTLLISNLHCSSCTTTIRLLLAPLSPAPLSITANIVTHQVTVVHLAELSPNEILQALREAEFEVDSVSITTTPGDGSSSRSSAGNGGGAPSLDRAIDVNHPGSNGYLFDDWGENVKAAFESGREKRKRHIELCDLCRTKEEKKGPVGNNLPLGGSRPAICFTELSSANESVPILQEQRQPAAERSKNCLLASTPPHYTCGDAPYNSAIPSSSSDPSNPWRSKSTSDIAIHITSPKSDSEDMTNSNSLQKDVSIRVGDESVSANEDLEASGQVHNAAPKVVATLYEATFSIEGMTCSACTGKVNETIGALPGVKSVDVALMSNSATVTFEGVKEDAEKIVDEVECIGYGCILASIRELNADGSGIKAMERVVQIQVGGMFCAYVLPALIISVSTYILFLTCLTCYPTTDHVHPESLKHYIPLEMP